jgi:hypothetical protein
MPSSQGSIKSAAQQDRPPSIGLSLLGVLATKPSSART